MNFNRIAQAFEGAPNPPPEKPKKRTAPRNIRPEVFEAAKKATMESGWPHDMHLVGKGSENFVFFFEDDKHKDIVYKVNYLNSFDVFCGMMNDNLQEYRQGVIGLKKAQKDRRAKLKVLREYFGFSAVPVEKTMIRNMPVDAGIVKELTGRGYTSEQLAKLQPGVPALVTIQRKVDIKRQGDEIELGCNFPERTIAKDPNAATIYDEGYRLLVTQEKNNDWDENRQKEIVEKLYPESLMIGLRIDHDPEFKESLRSFVSQAIKIGNEKGIYLDLVGNGNLYFVKQPTGWQPKLIDVLLPLFNDSEKLAESVEKIKQGKSSDIERKSVMTMMNSIRTINALAVLVGLPDRINAPELLDVPSETWARGYIDMRSVKRRESKPMAA
ncbi:MAG: hypothetical protein PHC53_02230 [Patescibacteria group bacterium]|nr:hypothetical protein [Patescibacteria group bacterium]